MIYFMDILNHQRRFLCHQFGFPLLESILIKNFLVSSQSNNSIENPNPGIPNKKKSKGLPPNTEFTPGTYSKKTNRIVSVNTPKNICLLKPEYISEIYIILK